MRIFHRMQLSKLGEKYTKGMWWRLNVITLGETVWVKHKDLCKQFAKIAKMTYYLCDSKYRERYLGLRNLDSIHCLAVS